MPTREFEFLKTIIAPLGQLTAAGLVAAWLTPHVATITASAGLVVGFFVAVRRMYLLIQEEATDGTA